MTTALTLCLAMVLDYFLSSAWLMRIFVSKWRGLESRLWREWGEEEEYPPPFSSIFKLSFK